MASAATTVKVFGAYIIVTGITLMFAPNLLLGIFGFAAAHEVWVRVLGAVALILGYYYWACAAAGVKAFYTISVRGRVAFFVLTVAFVATGIAPWMLVVLGLADLSGAVWTRAALRAEDREIHRGSVEN
ncbi:MAG TPA: hypothetical protein VIM14_10745 [Polyangia bacterium]